MTARLQAAGVRPISAIVDITNYVLIELGHPMHAFDLAKLAGAEIRVRRAEAGETHHDARRRRAKARRRHAGHRRPRSRAGDRRRDGRRRLGGLARRRRRVAFESAYFKPASVRRTSKRLGLKTEASSRFERGADIGAPVVALQRARGADRSIGAGQVVGPVVDCYPQPRGAAHAASAARAPRARCSASRFPTPTSSGSCAAWA